jgi:hypothetical protein
LGAEEVAVAQNGDYIIHDVEAGTGYTVGAVLAGYISGTTPSFEVHEPVIGKNLTLQLPGLTVSGTITTDDGELPVTTAVLTVQRAGQPVTEVGPVTIDENGNYSIANVPSGAGYTLTAGLTHYKTRTTASFDVFAPVTGKDLTLPRIIYKLQGQILLEDIGGAGLPPAEPLEHAWITITDGAGNPPVSSNGTFDGSITKADGSFEMPLKSGSLDAESITIRASLPGFTLPPDSHPKGVPVNKDAFVVDDPVNPQEIVEVGDLRLVWSHYYVSVNGDDGYEGSENFPFLTLSHAAELAARLESRAREVIVLGTLDERSGNPGSPSSTGVFNLADLSPKTVTIRGKGPLEANAPYSAELTQTGNRGVLAIGRFNSSNPVYSTSMIILKDIAITGANDTGTGSGINISGYLFTAPIQVTLDNCIVEHNKSSEGGGLSLTNTTNIVVRNTIIRNNEASRRGGGVRVSGSSVIRMENSYIRNNTAGAPGGQYIAGGGVYIDSSSFTMDGGAIEDNVSHGDGGGVVVEGSYSSSESFTMTGGSIKRNKANTDGGGIYMSGSIVSIKNGTIIENNEAGSDGGGVYISGARMTMDSSSIRNNSAVDGGGGVGLYGAIASVAFVMQNNSRIAGNTARDGGGLWWQDTTKPPALKAPLTIESGSVIYGSDAAAADKNTAGIKGHTIYDVGNNIATNTTINAY